MNTLRSTLACTALVAALSSAPLAAADVYLKIDGIEGESATASRSAPVEISSFSFGASNAGEAQPDSRKGGGKVSLSDFSMLKPASRVVTPREPQSGLPTGQRMHKPMTAAPVASGDASSSAADVQTVTVVLPATESDTSRALDRACASGTHIKNAELRNSAQQLSLSDVVVSSCAASSSERRYEFRGHVTLMK
jgi:type VI protein secretion system component Hcp